MLKKWIPMQGGVGKDKRVFDVVSASRFASHKFSNSSISNIFNGHANTYEWSGRRKEWLSCVCILTMSTAFDSICSGTGSTRTIWTRGMTTLVLSARDHCSSSGADYCQRDLIVRWEADLWQSLFAQLFAVIACQQNNDNLSTIIRDLLQLTSRWTLELEEWLFVDSPQSSQFAMQEKTQHWVLQLSNWVDILS